MEGTKDSIKKLDDEINKISAKNNQNSTIWDKSKIYICESLKNILQMKNGNENNSIEELIKDIYMLTE